MSLINVLNCQEILGSSLFISGCFQNGKNHDCFHFGNSRLEVSDALIIQVYPKENIVQIGCTINAFFVFLSEQQANTIYKYEWLRTSTP